MNSSPPRRAEIPSILMKNICGSKTTTVNGKSCGPDKICNPLTGRCVNRDGKIGSAAMKIWATMNDKEEKRPKSPRKSPSPRRAEITITITAPTKNICGSKTTTANGKSCGPDKICNPLTGRCVNQDGKIGSTVLKI